MALAFPRPGLAGLVGFTPESQPFRLDPRPETSRTEGGAVIAVSTRPQLWQLSLSTVRVRRREAMAVQAFLQSLDGGSRTFLLHDPSRPNPAADTGASLAGVEIEAATAATVALRGLPAGYEMTPGDLIGWQWGGGRYALHEVQEAVTADGSGETTAFDVRPAVRGDPAAGTAVTLREAPAEWVLLDWSARQDGRLFLRFDLSAVQRA